jgi:hypothetical protein
MGQNPPTEGENLFLDPLLWPQASFDPHVAKPIFPVDSENVCFQQSTRFVKKKVSKNVHP